MEKPKPIYLIILGVAVLALIYIYVVRGTGDDIGSEPAAPAQTQTTPKPTDAQTKTVPPKTSPSDQKPSPTSPSKSGSTSVNIPKSVASAMLKHRVVVVLFWSPLGSTDRTVKKSIDRLRNSVSKGDVAIFTASTKRIADYSFIAGDVRQSPAVVVVNRAYGVTVLQGYVDYESILQSVREASRVKPPK